MSIGQINSASASASASAGSAERLRLGLRQAFDSHDVFAVQSRICGFARLVRGKYGGRIDRSRLYHILIGSTPPECEMNDLPGGEVARFVESLRADWN